MPCVFQGTTGSPKGATLSHRNIVNNAYLVGLRLKIREQVSLLGTGFGEAPLQQRDHVWGILVFTQWKGRKLCCKWHWGILMHSILHFNRVHWCFILVSRVAFFFLGKKRYLFVGEKHEMNHFSFCWMLISNNYKTLDVHFEFCWMRF